MQSTTKSFNGVVFSDSEEEIEDIQIVNNEVSYRLQENKDDVFRAFKEFLSAPEIINSRNDPTTNIVDRYANKCYNIPPRKIGRFMRYLEVGRRRNLKMMMYEKQDTYSGIMLDFDIRVSCGGKSPITKTHYHRLCINVFRVLMKYIHYASDEINQSRETYVGFIRKPKLVYCEDGDYYKDGIHMLIPGFKIKRNFKKLIISELIEHYIEKIFKEITPHESWTYEDFLDVNSAHVGVFFVGSASKINTPAYELDAIYKIAYTTGDCDDTIPVLAPALMTNEKFLVCYEMSLNWQRNPDKGGVITKANYEIKVEYEDLLPTNINMSSSDDDVIDDLYNDMSILNLCDSDSIFVKSLLDILHPKRYEEYNLWFDVLCALSSTNSSYKTLADYFSRKCVEKYNTPDFEKTWNSISKQKKSGLTIGSIHHWAKIDNPDRYNEVKSRSVLSILYKKIYDSSIEGILEHFDVAEILFTVLSNKYVFDRGCESGRWYEFMVDGEQMQPGEMYKWRKYDRTRAAPTSLLKYISMILPKLFSKVSDRIKNSLDDADTGLAKYHYQIYCNFKKSYRCLKNSGFKKHVCTEAEQLFERRSFADDLDSNPNIKGVGNGILLLGKKCKLITGFHGHLVSKFTKAHYIQFNPHKPLTKKVLIALRNLFPDDEPDTFEYIMHYLASTLDGNKKESIMLLLVGKGSNGKSFLVELHKGAIGEQYGVKMPLSFLTNRAKNSENATPALMQLKDAHFAYYSESNKFEILNMAKIKEFTGQETLAGRRLHEGYINFKPKCHHLVATNNDFEILGTDHGTWRRIDYVTMKIKFCNLATDDYDPENPYERIADTKLGSKWAEDSDVLATYLGILAYYYESLHTKYEGKVRNVPHPHIIKETEDFRNRQDRINNFLNSSLIKCADNDFEMSLLMVKNVYIQWYENNYPGTGKEYQRTIIDQLENSKLQKFIRKNRRGSFIKGYKVLGIGEDKDEDDTFYQDTVSDSKNNIQNIKSESSEDYCARLCKEFGNPEQVDLRQPEIKEESDSDIEDEIIDIRRRAPSKFKKKFVEKKHIDSNGMRTLKTKPKKNYKEFAMLNSRVNSDSESEAESDSE